MDGIGWYWEMVCQLRWSFGYTLEQVMTELTLAQAFAEMAWATEADAITRAFGGIRRKGKGYIGREADELMKLIK